MLTPPLHFPKDVCENKLCILDTRAVDCFAKGHIEESIHLPLVPNFISYAALALDPSFTFTLLLDEEERYEQVKQMLSQAGIKKVEGLVKSSVGEWKRETLPSVLREEIDRENSLIVDVRTAEEFEANHLPKSLHLPLEKILSLDKALASAASIIYLICSGGTRSSIAASLLMRRGVKNVCNIKNGLSG